jgi:rhodanese-related sulfurtransferase
MQSEKIEKRVEDPDFYLINVLDEKDFNDAHIVGSIHVPFSKINLFLNEIENKNIPIIFYCSNYFCTASDAAAIMAIKKKFNTVFVYKGGMAEWYQASLEDKSFEYNGPAKADYLKIVIVPPSDELDAEVDPIAEDKNDAQNIKIISINNLQNFLKNSKIIK